MNEYIIYCYITDDTYKCYALDEYLAIRNLAYELGYPEQEFEVSKKKER